MDDRDIATMFETLFDIRSVSTRFFTCSPRRMMKRKKRTAEERRAELERREDLTRRILERIEYYRARVVAAERREGAS